MSKNNLENDYCDLDPTKICDNCCKCIDHPEGDYKTVLADFEAKEALLGSDFLYDDESYDEGFGGRIPYEKIDPALLAEWEAKLAAAEAREKAESEAAQRHRNVKGVRRRKEERL